MTDGAALHVIISASRRREPLRQIPSQPIAAMSQRLPEDDGAVGRAVDAVIVG